MRLHRFAFTLLTLTTIACGPAADPDAGTGDAGPADVGLADAPRPVDSGSDSGQDGGPSCTTGCAFVELALGFEHSCARRENGEVLCWGRAQDGELGDDRMRHSPGCRIPEGTSVDCAARPVSVALPGPVTAISSRGGFSSCALEADGDVWCWGDEGFPIAGAMERVRFAPEQFPNAADVAEVSESYTHICFRSAAGAIRCAGYNDSGQLGRGDFAALEPMPAPVLALATGSGGGGEDAGIDAGAVDAGGGSADAGPAADGGPPATMPILDVLEVDTATAFGAFSCARTADAIWCWGDNESGQLGRGATPHTTCRSSGLDVYDCSAYAVEVDSSVLDPSTVVEIATGSNHACARTSAGAVYCWGENRGGQLGVGDDEVHSVPTLVPGITDAVQLAAGARHTCARRMDGTVRCWGVNQRAQIGDGNESHGNCTISSEAGGLVDCVTSPTEVMSIDDASYLATGREHTCVIRAAGTEIWCWGANDKLQLGDGPTTAPSPEARRPRFAPVRVIGL